jgi:hypothetical protein
LAARAVNGSYIAVFHFIGFAGRAVHQFRITAQPELHFYFMPDAQVFV